MGQINRTEGIDTILDKVDAEFPQEMGVDLEAYIAKLEVNQKVVQVDDQPAWDSNNPPVWSHERAMQHEHHRQERAWRKWKMMNDYHQGNAKHPVV